jgi:DNA repair protein SbcC/Rad50
MNLQTAREKLGKKFTNVSEISSGVLKGTRRRGERDFASYIFDLNDRLSETAGYLSTYLDDVVGKAYFDDSAPPDLRWNQYLYFVVKRGTESEEALAAAKHKVETDRNYARKYVVFEEEFESVLEELDSIAVADGTNSTSDIMQVWADKLSAAGLQSVLDVERPITDVVRSISQATPKQSIRTQKVSGVDASRQLVTAALSSLDLSEFREHPIRKVFEGLGKANLIVGSNGVGKTSFLEGVEYLFCGANRRSDRSPQRKVSGRLITGETVATVYSQPSSDFKTRQRLWFGSDDASRRNNLPNQFARFNFLNTDAAAELSLFGDDPKVGPGRNTESLADLLSGHEATLLSRRIEAVSKAVSDEKRARNSNLAVMAADKSKVSSELKAIELAPNQSDAAFAVFSKDLERVNWRSIPSNKMLVSVELANTLSDLVSQLGIVRQLDWIDGAATIEFIATQSTILQGAEEGIGELRKRVNASAKKRATLANLRQKLNKRREALGLISTEAVADLLENVQKLQVVDVQIKDFARAFAALPTDSPAELDCALSDLTITQASQDVDDGLRSTNEDISNTQHQLTALTTKQSKLQSVLTQLRDLARQSVEHLHSDENCPVCGTQFKPGELLRQMEDLAVAPSEMEALAMRQRLDGLQAKQQVLAQAANRLGQLVTFVAAINQDPSTVTADDAMRSASELKRRRIGLLDNRLTLQAAIDGYMRNGLSLDSLRELFAPIESDEKIAFEPFDIASAKTRIDGHVQKIDNELSVVDAEILQLTNEAMHRFGQIGIIDEVSLSTAFDVLQSRRDSVQLASKACDKVCLHANIPPFTDLRFVHASLEAAVLGANSVISAVARDEGAGSKLKALKEQLRNLEQRSTRMSETLKRLAGASKILDDLVNNHSLESASEALVAATHQVADSIFRRIHLPAEYRITADASSPLSHRDNGKAVTLNEVSTGQRAAYALSVFLAMNAQVKTGPKVILLDDPISHVDDLNALSFLDYLRNLVLQSDRQVFFATADEKIAGLFAHKFGFLGEDFRTIELART